MLTAEQKGLVSKLASGEPEERIPAELFLATSMMAAASGEESLVPGLLRMMGHAVGEGVPLSEAMRKFICLALSRAANSQDAIRHVAGTAGKRGRRPKPSRDGEILWRYAELRATGVTTEGAEAQIASEFHLTQEAVNTVVDKLRGLNRRTNEAIRRADELLGSQPKK